MLLNLCWFRVTGLPPTTYLNISSPVKGVGDGLLVVVACVVTRAPARSANSSEQDEPDNSSCSFLTYTCHGGTLLKSSDRLCWPFTKN